MSRRFLLAYLGLVIVVLVALEVPLGIQNGRNERRTLEAKVERDASTLASLATGTLGGGSSRALDALAAIAYSYRRSTGGRIVIVDRRGVAAIDTNPSGPGAESFATRPEMAAALRGQIATGTRYSTTLHTNLLYVAVPVAAGGRISGAVRITYRTSAVDARVRRYWYALAAIGGIVLAVATLVGIRLATFVARPLRRVERAAAAVGRGDLSARAPEREGPPEVQSLASVFNDTATRLQQLLRSQDEFVADASHQLRTPLTALRLRLENLAYDVEPGGRQELSAALAELERMSELVDGLLALARADADTAVVGEVDLGRVAEERVAAWSALAEERGLTLVAKTSGEPIARASEQRVAQVLDNLVENAVEVSPLGATVTVEARSVPPWAELRVRDEGPGLSPEARSRAFDRFWRGRGGQGSGLGLAIARRLVEADGGQVELVDADRSGLEAVVRLRST